MIYHMQIVWAKLNKAHWAGFTLQEEQVSQPLSKPNHIWIFWFGDYRLSEVNVNYVLPFQKSFKELSKKRVISTKWYRGIVEALKLYGDPMTEEYSDGNLWDWANNGFPGSREDAPFYELPEVIEEKLKKLVEKQEQTESQLILQKPTSSKMIKVLSSVKFKSMLYTATSPLTYQKARKFESKNQRELLRGGPSNQTLCVGCFTKDVTCDHPFFYFKMCQKCQNKLKTTMYCEERNKNFAYCTICGFIGKVVRCDRVTCSRVYCNSCLNDLFPAFIQQRIRATVQWLCFLCDPEQDTAGVLEVRSQWRKLLRELFMTDEIGFIRPPILGEMGRQRVRVLSLFDGISTGRYVLDQMNVDVDVYYSCEIDEDCKKVNSKNYPDVIDLGDISNLSSDVLAQIVPIDLVIGGSPCNDLSLVNPDRKGIWDCDGSGALFFDFYRVLCSLRYCNGNEFYWMFENVAAMPLKYRQTITRFFECEPHLIDAQLMSGQIRPRLYWGNIPTLSGQLYLDHKFELNSVLDAEKRALFDKLQTVTTRSNSLKQGKRKRNPVFNTLTNQEESLSINELERLFGFPTDYTNAEGLSNTARHKLLGKSWSVHVIRQLFAFLREQIKTERDDNY